MFTPKMKSFGKLTIANFGGETYEKVPTFEKKEEIKGQHYARFSDS